MNLHKHQSYVLKQHCQSLTIWSAIIRIITEGKSLVMKLGPGPNFLASDENMLVLAQFVVLNLLFTSLSLR